MWGLSERNRRDLNQLLEQTNTSGDDLLLLANTTQELVGQGFIKGS